MRKTIGQAMTMSMRDTTCSICTMEFEPPCEIMQLGCHKKHIYHSDCLDDWIQTNERANKVPFCPMCRVPIDKNAMVKKQLTAPPVDEKKHDPFHGLAQSKTLIEKQNMA